MPTGNRRDNFSARTKRDLAERVAYRCGFPGCATQTIGPDPNDPTKSITLGEAAHITAASPGGPRYDDRLTPEQRGAHANGIWMCRHHAYLVDAAESSFAEETLRLWKRQSEQRAGAALSHGLTPAALAATTLVGLGLDLVFDAEWAGWSGGETQTWEFRLLAPVRGSFEDLTRFLRDLPELAPHRRVVVVESQGEGRVLRLGASMAREHPGHPPLLALPVEPPPARVDPLTIGMSPVMTDEGEFAMDGAGGMVMVSGADAGFQRLRNVLHYPLGWGSPVHSEGFGSLLRRHFDEYADQPELLGRLLTLDLARLTASPLPAVGGDSGEPVLAFVDHVLSATVVNADPAARSVRVRMSLSLVGGERRTVEMTVRLPTGNYHPRPAER